MIFSPLNGHIVVKRLGSEKVTRGGIILPDNAQKESQIGKVRAVYSEYVDHEGHLRAPLVKAGDTILFPKYEGEEIVLDGEKLVVMKDTCVRGLIHEYDAPASDGNGEPYERKTQRLTQEAYAEASA
jgi:chaperonin GroES